MTEHVPVRQTSEEGRSLGERLESNLLRQSECYTELLHLLKRKRRAIGTADAGSISDLCRQEQVVLARIGELEGERQSIALALSDTPAGGPSTLLTLREITARLAPDNAARLEVLAQTIREQATEAQKQSGIIHTAAEALRRHVEGVMQMVHGALHQVGLYGRQGRITQIPTATATIDLTM